MQDEMETKEGAGVNMEGEAGRKEGDSRSRDSTWGCVLVVGVRRGWTGSVTTR